MASNRYSVISESSYRLIARKILEHARLKGLGQGDMLPSVRGLAEKYDVGKAVVWKSNLLTIPKRVQVGEDAGGFVGLLSGKKQLGASKIYHIRVRQQSDAGKWSAWSLWHQPFKTAESP